MTQLFSLLGNTFYPDSNVYLLEQTPNGLLRAQTFSDPLGERPLAPVKAKGKTYFCFLPAGVYTALVMHEGRVVEIYVDICVAKAEFEPGDRVKPVYKLRYTKDNRTIDFEAMLQKNAARVISSRMYVITPIVGQAQVLAPTSPDFSLGR